MNARGSTTWYRQVRWLPLLPSAGSGFLVLAAVDRRLVRVDGVVLQHRPG